VIFYYCFLLIFCISAINVDLYSQAIAGKPVYTIPCSIYDSPIILNDHLKIINLGSNVNSYGIDYAPTVSLDGKTVYFVSDRDGSKKRPMRQGDPDTKMIPYEFIVVKSKNSVDTLPSVPKLKDYFEKNRNTERLKLISIDSVWIIIDTSRAEKLNLISEYNRDTLSDENSHDFWYVTKFERLDTTFSNPRNLDTSTKWGNLGVNTHLNEGAASISADGKMIFFTGCNRPNGMGDCDLFVSHLDGETWSRPIPLDSNVNSRYWDSQPSIAPYNKRIYFSSTRPGPNSDGRSISNNMDIWYCDRSEGLDNWLPAKNLSAINTKGREWAPFIAADGVTLFFSSDSIKGGYGGSDFYVTRWNPNTDTWSEPVNLGKPLNTPQDDMFISMPASGDVLYFSSARTDLPNAQGGLDIYMAYVPEYLSGEICSGDSYFSLNNFPNPFSGSTTIEYTVASESPIKIALLNVMGEVVRLLTDEKQISGTYKVTWDGNNEKGQPAPSGLYLIKIDYNENGKDKQVFKKVMLMR